MLRFILVIAAVVPLTLTLLPVHLLAKRFGCDARYDDQAFRVQPGKCVEPVLDASTVKGGGKAATT